MKIVLVFRKARPDAFSIEELFRTLATELRKHVEVVEFEAGERSRILHDVAQLRQLNADVYHVTGDVNYFVSLLPRRRTVLTVHDIGHLSGLSGWRRAVYRLGWFTLPLKRAASVACVSQDTRDKLLKEFKIRGEVELIENWYASRFRHSPKGFNRARPRILQVGTKPYKNVPRLVRALRGVNCHLVLIGSLDRETLAALETSQVSYENRVNLSSEEVLEEYVAADMVTFASLGEGFGVPIIEAQAMGRPLVTSDVSPLREVAGPGACTVDPLSEDSIRAGIVRIVEDDAYRESVVRTGLLNARRYSPETAAAAYADLYRRVALSRSRAHTPQRSAR